MAGDDGEPCREYVVEVDRTQGDKLGIDVAEGEDPRDPLVIIGLKDGLIESWNCQQPGLEVRLGHRLVEVNGVRGSAPELKALCREHQQLRLVLNVPEDTVAKSLRPGHPQLALPKMSPEAASCGVAVSAPRKALELPKSCWMCVTWHLFTHELLGKFARISSAFAALLGDEHCWRTLAEPKRPAITERLLQLMLVEEQDLWAWPLCQVRNVDLDLSCAEHSTIQHVRTLLMKKLDVEETLQQVRLRNIPMAAKPREDSYTEFDQDLIRLVNPVHPKYPAGFCTSFLITDQLGSLRQHFHNFRFEMFPSRSAAGEPLSALEVVAVRGLEGTPWLEKKQFEDLSTKAAELVEFELGQLRQLPPSQILVTDRFEDWKDRLAKAYRRMLALHG